VHSSYRATANPPGPVDIAAATANLIAVERAFLATSASESLGRAYGLPLALHYGEPLAQNPAVIALLNLLDLPTSDFRRRDLLDTLRSPYFDVVGLPSEQVDLLERIGQALLVTGGREAWLNALRYSVRRTDSAAYDDEDTLDVPSLEPGEAERLIGALSALFDAITPPPEASVRDYVRWLETLIGPDEVAASEDQAPPLEDGYSLSMLRQVRRPALESHIVARDLAALYEFKCVLRSLLSAQSLLAALGEGGRVTWQTFLADLRAAVNGAAVNSRPSRAGRVLVTAATDARGLPHDHVFILGLSEGIFPAQTPEDPLYLDSERRRLRESGVFLETQAERAADDGLFFELISLRKTLTLSRPTVQDGKRCGSRATCGAA
jgi:hypothetical protein